MNTDVRAEEDLPLEPVAAAQPPAALSPLAILKMAAPFAVAIGLWLVPVPAGLTAPAWHLFAIFVSAILSVLLGAFPLLTSTMLAAAAVVLTGTLEPAKAFSGFANPT